jgi:hypothetical protein
VSLRSRIGFMAGLASLDAGNGNGTDGSLGAVSIGALV